VLTLQTICFTTSAHLSFACWMIHGFIN
jgi:hypothetical protein